MNKYMEMGLSEERYRQMMKSFNNDEEFIDEAINDWGIESVNKGYAIFDFDLTGMLQIEEINTVDAFNGSDKQATKEAIADGVKIIPVCDLPANFDRRYLGWIDTLENRKAIEDYCKGNHDCVWTYTVVERTASTVTITDGREVKKCRIVKEVSERSGAESIYPRGRYSMAPVLSA